MRVTRNKRCAKEGVVKGSIKNIFDYYYILIALKLRFFQHKQAEFIHKNALLHYENIYFFIYSFKGIMIRRKKTQLSTKKEVFIFRKILIDNNDKKWSSWSSKLYNKTCVIKLSLTLLVALRVSFWHSVVIASFNLWRVREPLRQIWGYPFSTPQHIYMYTICWSQQQWLHY